MRALRVPLYQLVCEGKERSLPPHLPKDIGKDMLHLANLRDTALSVEALKGENDLATGRVPTQEVSDPLVHYEAHLSREFDRTLSQLERLQRMRRGQPVPPPMKLEISS